MIHINNFQRLIEVFDKSEPFKWTNQTKDIWSGTFKIHLKNDGWIDYETSFYLDDWVSPPSWAAEFEVADSSDVGIQNDDSMGILNLEKGLQFKVFATVKAMTEYWIQKVKPQNFYFVAKEPSRVRLYRRFTKELSKKGYTVKEKSDKGDVVFGLEKIN